MIEDSNSRWWEAEYYEMLAAHQVKTGEKFRITRMDVILATWPKPKLSDVLRCAHLAKEQPEIWALAQEQAKIAIEDWDDDDNRMSNLIALFEGWFVFKNGLRDHDTAAFASISLLLREWLQPGFDGDEVAVARRILRPSTYIDDLADAAGDKQ